jgi:hypothetical protein
MLFFGVGERSLIVANAGELRSHSQEILSGQDRQAGVIVYQDRSVWLNSDYFTSEYSVPRTDLNSYSATSHASAIPGGNSIPGNYTIDST